MTTTRHIPDKARTGLSLHLENLNKALPPKAFFLLAALIVILSVPAALDLSPRPHLLLQGQIAPSDIIADSSFVYRNTGATQSRQELNRRMQPLVLDLVARYPGALREYLQQLLLELNQTLNRTEQEDLHRDLSSKLGRVLDSADMTALSSPALQSAALNYILPFLEAAMRKGILQDLSILGSYPGGAIIRNLTTQEETLIPDSFVIPDVKRMDLELDGVIKELVLTNAEKRMLDLIFSPLIQPSLVPNLEVTAVRAERLAENVDPVVQRVQRGEIIIRKGELVSLEQQLKMQIYLQNKGERFNTKAFMGTALFGLLISTGLLFSPSTAPSTSMLNKDFVFLGSLLLIFSLLAKGLAAHGALIAEISAKFLPESLVFAMPVAGAAALSAQIFSTRRYLVTGVLISLFCTLMMGAGLAVFLFYFLSYMWNTWLTYRNASRSDVVWSMIPLSVGLLALWAAATMLQGGAHTRYLSELLALLGGGVFFSMLLTFALTPLVEIVFGYTTRFRLMEMMNLEQPLLQDLMLQAPGTYHHSLIVSNMCEAGAKRIGVQSMLCKVAALYHDIGKSGKAGYFIENQSNDENPHNRLTPSMSALILISHVKQGTELARQHRLGREVTDIMGQHHGTSMIQYFYNKALGMPDAPPPEENDFRYPGPKPQSKEAAIVMLADIAEASSRALTDISPQRLLQHVEGVMKNSYASGQLDECGLTLRDLHELTDSFTQVLRGIHHHRINYPGGKEDNGKRKVDK
ncbi:MAG: HDIG domain-containing protein [Desulfovibrio sp.]|jgi:putative nucleotidyltransferase with HDIG domain|nr:HDIG domain-containing protein [Desulfovibrio sp.]